MARSFNGSTQRATNGAAISDLITASAGTICLWYKPAGTPVASSDIEAMDVIFGDSDQYVALYRGNWNSGGDQVHAANYESGDQVVSATLTVGQWDHWTWYHRAGELYLYKNGVSQGFVSSNDTAQLTHTYYVMSNVFHSLYTEGEVAEIAVWNEGLSDNEILAIARGCSPLRIRPVSCTAYWPFWGLHSPEIDLMAANRQLTLTAAPVQSNHAPVLPFSAHWWSNFPEQPAAATAPFPPWPANPMRSLLAQ